MSHKKTQTITDPRFTKSHRLLLDSAIGLFLENPQASMSELAKYAKVGRATLYRHFESKEELIYELAKESLTEMNNATSVIDEKGLQGRKAIEAILEKIIPLAHRFHFIFTLWDIAAQDKEVKEIYRLQRESLTKRVGEAKDLNEFDSELPTEWIVSCIDSMISNVWFCLGETNMNTNEAITFAKSTLFSGISSK